MNLDNVTKQQPGEVTQHFFRRLVYQAQNGRCVYVAFCRWREFGAEIKRLSAARLRELIGSN